MKRISALRRVSDRSAVVAVLAACLLAAGVLLGGTAAGAAAKWIVALAAESKAQAKSTSPAVPTGVRATCVSRATVEIRVSWLTAAHATGYTVYQSKTSGSYSSVATVTATDWTSGTLTNGKYTFEVSTSIGSRWTSSRSSSTSSRTITSSKTTKCK